MSLAELIATADARGIRLWVEGGRLQCWSPVPLTDDVRSLLLAHRPGLVTYLAAVRWDRSEANRLMEAADALVEELGVNGLAPKIQAAAGRVGAACQAGRLPALRAGIAEFERVVRVVAFERGRGRPRSPCCPRAVME